MPLDELSPEPHLTPRQLDCMELVKKGLTSKQIARELAISHRTVEAHVAAVIEVLQVNNRMAAVTRLEEIRQQQRQSQDLPARNLFMLDLPNENAENDLITFTKGEVDDGAQGRPSPRLFPPLYGTTSDVPMAGRIAWIIRIAAMGVMLSCMAYLFIMGVSEMAAGSPT